MEAACQAADDVYGTEKMHADEHVEDSRKERLRLI